MYVFPGIGLAAILSKAKHISQEMIYASATALSSTLRPDEFASGMLYPSLDRIRDVSVIVARDVIRTAQREKLDREPSLRDMSNGELEDWIKERMYDPRKEDGYLELMRERNEELKREVEIADFEVREKLSAKL
jgi:malate dehydrogenase (oxaloacetate-decarboxylating)(NADP+)